MFLHPNMDDHPSKSILRANAQDFWPSNPNPLPSPNIYPYTYPYPYPYPYPYHLDIPPPLTTPTKSLLLSLVPQYVNEPMIHRDLMVFGKIRNVELERLREGLITVHFYDLRQATEALHEIQKQYLQQQRRLFSLLSYGSHASPPLPLPPASGLIGGSAVWAQFTFPVISDDNNSNQETVFERNVKGVRENPNLVLIKEDEAVTESDSRTTLRINNIPNKYSKEGFMNKLDSHCIQCNKQITDEQPSSSYNFVHLPMDYKNKCNVGYGFVNMISPVAAMRLYNAFHHMKWDVMNSQKICQVSYSRLQGLDALKEHFKDSRFPCKEYTPVVFDPPRDGHVLTQATPINEWERRHKRVLLFGSFPMVS